MECVLDLCGQTLEEKIKYRPQYNLKAKGPLFIYLFILEKQDKTYSNFTETFVHQCKLFHIIGYVIIPNPTVRVLGQLCQFVSYSIPTPLDMHKRKGVKKQSQGSGIVNNMAKGSKTRRVIVRPRDMNLHYQKGNKGCDIIRKEIRDVTINVGLIL